MLGGKNGDETGVAIGFLLGTHIYIYKVFGVAGGYSEESLQRIVREIKASGTKEVFIEKNFGHGAFQAIIAPYFEREWPCSLEEDYATGQKEARIIETLEPLMNAHRLIFNMSIIQEDVESIKCYPIDKQKSYSIFHQISGITLEKGSLRHDDRLDALYGLVRQLVGQVQYDELSAITRQQQQGAADYYLMMNDPKRRREYMWGEPSNTPSSPNVLGLGGHRVVKKGSRNVMKF